MQHRWCRVQSCFQCKYDGQAQACVSRDDIAGTPTPTPSPSDNEPDFPPFAPLPCSETPDICKAGGPCTQYFGCAWHELLGMSCDLQGTGLRACATECAGWGLCPEVGPLPCQVKNLFHAYKGGNLPAVNEREWPFNDLASAWTSDLLFDYLAQNGIDITSHDSNCQTITPSPTPTSNTGGSLLGGGGTDQTDDYTGDMTQGCDSSETTTANWVTETTNDDGITLIRNVTQTNTTCYDANGDVVSTHTHTSTRTSQDYSSLFTLGGGGSDTPRYTPPQGDEPCNVPTSCDACAPMYACAMRLFESFAVSDDGDLQINTSLAVDHPNDICTQDEIEAAGCTGCVKFALAPAAHGQNGLTPFLVDLLSAINALLANTPSDQIPTNDELRQAFPFWPFNNLADGVSIKDVLDHVKYCDVDLSDLPDWAGFPTPSPGPDYSPGPYYSPDPSPYPWYSPEPSPDSRPPPLWDNPSCDTDIPDVCTLDGECGYIYQCLFPELPQGDCSNVPEMCTGPCRDYSYCVDPSTGQPGSQYDDDCANAPSDCGQVCGPYGALRLPPTAATRMARRMGETRTAATRTGPRMAAARTASAERPAEQRQHDERRGLEGPRRCQQRQHDEPPPERRRHDPALLDDPVHRHRAVRPGASRLLPPVRVLRALRQHAHGRRAAVVRCSDVRSAQGRVR